MKNYYTKFMSFAAMLIAAVLLMPDTTQAQEYVETQIDDGKEYWIGVPHCRKEEGEKFRGGFPMQLWVSSKVDTRVNVKADYIGMDQFYAVKKNEIKVIPLNDELMNKESEEIKDYGIQIIGDDPINVVVYLSYQWSGEAYRCIPVEWLGKKYVTFNLYLDKTDDYRPPQFLIVATKNNTRVSYIPSGNTVKHDAGRKVDITLNQGQTYLVEGRMTPGMVHMDQTDLSGTLIQSTEPIAVISGHTKGAFPRYQSHMLGRAANFMRNMLTEMLWPTELLGKKYISAPILYKNRKRGVSPDDKGDLMRFIATENGTDIYRMRQDGTGEMLMWTGLDRGEWRDIVTQEDAAMYTANKPIAVAQYGKTWWDHEVTPIIGKDDKPQNPSRNGQGMLITLAPIERWCTYAAFKSPEGIDNFFYMTFKDGTMDKIKFDGQSLLAKFGSAVKPIKGTPYVYLATEIGIGDHWIESIDDDARFAAYAYGNWDYCKDGFAYGYPVGINYATPCEDSLYVTDVMTCGNVEGNGYAVALTDETECVGLFRMTVEDALNYTFDDHDFEKFDKEAHFTLNINNPNDSAYAKVRIMTLSAKEITKEYIYQPEKVKADPTLLDFGVLKANEEVCKTLTLTNPGNTNATINDIRLKDETVYFTYDTDDLPVTLAPGETKEIEICALSPELLDYTVRDSVIVDLSCYSRPVAELRFKMGEPVVWISDADWGEVPVGEERAQKVQIVNQAKLPVEIYSITWDDHDHFTRVEGLNFPLVVEAGTPFEFTAYYKPDAPGNNDYTRATFEANTNKDKLYSDWNGTGITAGPVITGYDWQFRRVLRGDQFDPVDQTVGYEGEITISNSGNSALDVVSVHIENNDESIFEIARDVTIPAQLQPGETITIDAWFFPKDEVSYESTVVFKASFEGTTKSANAKLQGIGQLPHVEMTGYEFTTPLEQGQSATSDEPYFKNLVMSQFPMELTVFDLRIEGPDANAFEIDPQFYIDNPFNITMTPDEVINIPVKFTAIHNGKHTARLVIDDDAPENPNPELIGYGFMQGLETTNHDFGTIFKTLSKSGQVSLTNTGTIDATITEPLMIEGDGANYFTIRGWKTENTGLDNPAVPFDLEPGDKLIVDVDFMPMEAETYDAYIEYTTSAGNAQSSLTGKGMEFRMIARIPKDKYVAIPGEKVEIEFMIDPHSEEAKALEQANITEFKAKVYFNEGNLPNDLMLIYPDVANANDIITNGTMTDGWTVADQYPRIVEDDGYLIVKFENDEPLKGSGVLFKFNMFTYLSDITTVDVPCEFLPQGVSANYTIVENEPGDIKIQPVCVNDLRLIVTTGAKYNLFDATPNPVSSLTTIKYSIGIKAHTSLSLYNSNGEKVTELVSGHQQPGVYEVDIDVSKLGIGSGSYYYRLESGPFESTKPMVIVK